MPNVGGSAARVDRARGPGEAATRARVLVVDDDESGRRALESLLRAEGFATTAAPDGEAALREAMRALPDVVITDLQMPGMSGMDVCQKIHEIDGDLPVIVITAFGDMDSVIESLRAGAEDYLIKPLHYDAVLWSLERAIARRAAKVEEGRLRHEKEELKHVLNERLVLSSIREHEHAEAEALQHAQLNALLENLKEGVVIADPSGRLLMMNRVARDILDVGGKDLLTIDELHLREVHSLEGRLLGPEERPLSRALRGEQFVDYEVLRVRANGERRRVVSTGTSVRNGNGAVSLAIVVLRDVTDLRRLEKQRDEYLALISHDLRNPLSTILMLLSLLKQSMRSAEGANVHLAERAERNVRRMAAMLEELSEVTGLESQGVVLHRVVCDLRELVAGVVDGLDDAHARRVTVEAVDGPTCVVFADAPRLERVLANLLTNALKYSADDAPVNVRLLRKGSAVELDVIDRGIGIAPENVERLFDRYYRVTAGKARAEGLGLGLYIARMIIDAHGGRITVSSEVGKGSTFRLSFPSHVPA